ncbi:MAG: urease accessory protein UreF [Corynebacterium sp.]|uniref:urease accessory protein UreF n=1 Tax=unclassified Corynebacterium TaxID=2624378 RepID=UPI00095D0231|nr:urease accessory UreF family protein [Corynebacterium sp. CNJ-954]OLT51899.1 urease accessory protein UreF [Corynebacterium sp. CNJ-954]
MLPMLPFLQALTYADSAYPSGRYTLSHGLEGLVQAGRVRGTQQVTDVLTDHLRHTAGPGDGVATAAAVMTDDLATLVTLDHELAATKVTGELRRASSRVGRQLLQVTAQVADRLGEDQPVALREYAAAVAAKEAPGNQAVAAGLIHACHGLDAATAVATELTGLAVGWAGAALRLRQCDHIGAQVAITAAHPVIAEVADRAVRTAAELLANGDWSMVGRASPGSDLASAAHETAPARLFMS